MGPSKLLKLIGHLPKKRPNLSRFSSFFFYFPAFFPKTAGGGGQCTPLYTPVYPGYTPHTRCTVNSCSAVCTQPARTAMRSGQIRAQLRFLVPHPEFHRSLSGRSTSGTWLEGPLGSPPTRVPWLIWYDRAKHTERTSTVLSKKSDFNADLRGPCFQYSGKSVFFSSTGSSLDVQK